MRKPGGQATIIGGAGTLAAFEPGKWFRVEGDQHEFDTWSCTHCNRQVHAAPIQKDNDYFFCRYCMGRICDPCADHPCTPFMKRIEQQEERAYRYRCIEV